ncbi:MAG: hypothetical protein OQK82_04060 [Candidatus Pacearchaeota archaeon]|nr:hypothetical protein [Candidatus Pacearchaeota archaeon]
MKKFILNKKGIDLSQSPVLENTRHIYLAPNNFYSLRKFCKPESMDFLYSKNLINESKFHRILLKEMLIYTKFGGKIIISFKSNNLLGYRSLMKEIRICIGDKIKLVYAKKGKNNLIILEKIKNVLEKGDSINKWSFGIITNGKKNEWIEKQISAIKEQEIPNYEIIICGTYFERKEENIKYLPFSKKDELGWITKKKNLICENAKYENLCVLHERVVPDRGWFKGMKKYGNYFEVLSCVIKDKNKKRCGDWITYGSKFGSFPFVGLLDYRDFDIYGCLDGGLTILKKSVWERVKWDENLFWNQAEDAKLSSDWYKEGIIARFNPFASCTTLSWRHGNLVMYNYDQDKRGDFIGDKIQLKRRIKFYAKEFIKRIY